MAILERILEIFSRKGARKERKMEILEQKGEKKPAGGTSGHGDGKDGRLLFGVGNVIDGETGMGGVEPFK